MLLKLLLLTVLRLKLPTLFIRLPTPLKMIAGSKAAVSRGKGLAAQTARLDGDAALWIPAAISKSTDATAISEAAVITKEATSAQYHPFRRDQHQAPNGTTMPCEVQQRPRRDSRETSCPLRGHPIH